MFENIDPIGRKLTVFGRKIEVIGLMTKEGDDMFGNSSPVVSRGSPYLAVLCS